MSKNKLANMHRLSWLSLFPLVGCITTEDPNVEALLEEVQSGASYAVPVAPELTPFASYPVTHVKWEAKKGVRLLEYKLPDELTGASNKVELTGPDTGASWVLEGEAGTATCDALADRIRCNEKLPGVTVDVAAVEARVEQGQLVPQKLAVTKLFNGDPLGVLLFTPNAARPDPRQ